MRPRHWVLAIAAAVLTASATSPAAQKPPSAYQRLDQKKLAQKLSAMGMFELLEGCAEQMTDPDSARYVLAQGKIARVAAGSLSDQQRKKLLDDAVDLLSQLQAATTGATDPKEVLHHCRIVLELVKAEGLLRPKPHALRLMYLQGGDADRRELIDMTETVMPRLAKLLAEIDETLTEWRMDMTKLVTVVPDLEALQQDARYKSAWAGFYRGLAMDDGPDKQRLLMASAAIARKFAAGDESSTVKHWSQLLAGMCIRELKGAHGQAARQLAAADVPTAAPPVRLQARFETVRNLIEWGQFRRAQQALKSFAGFGAKLLGRDGQLEIDVKATLLESYLYEQWAAAEGEPEASRQRLAASQQAMVAFLAKYDDRGEVTAAFLDLLAAKYRDYPRPEGLNSIILLAIAIDQRSGQGEGSFDKAQQLLEMILDRGDETSAGVHPDAVWQLATLMNARRSNVEAARLFVRLAREFPGHRLALQSAKNAIYSLNGVIQARHSAKAPVAANLRREFITTLETLLIRWGHRDDLAKWYFDLAWQYEAVAGQNDYDLMAKAVTAYQRLPRSMPESMRARHHALELMVKLLDGPKPHRPDGAKLVEMLSQYSTEAASAARANRDPATARQLRQWGATAAFRAATVLYQTLAHQALAMEQLKHLPQQWPDTEILPAVWEFEISKLVERKQTDQAIKKVDAFSKKHPGQARQLIRLVVRQIRKKIDQLRSDPAKADKLKTYQEVFHRFAEELFADAQAKGLAAEQMYPYQQTRAEAMLGVGKADEALEIFELCAAHDEAKTRAETQQIDEDIDRRISAAVSAAGNVTRTKQLADEHFSLISGGGAGASELRGAVRLAEAVRFLNKAADSTQQGERLQVVVDALIESLEKLRQARKRLIAVDAHNVLGQARAHRAMGNYPDALSHYNSFIAGLDRGKWSSVYWQVQLERCACYLDAYRGDPAQMRQLAVLIRQLALDDRMMGGLKDKFNAIGDAALHPGQDTATMRH